MQKPHILIIFLSLCCGISHAQYPFESVKSIQYKIFKEWKTTVDPKDELPVMREIKISKFDLKMEGLTIKQQLKWTLPDSILYSEMEIYSDNKIIKEFVVGNTPLYQPLPVFVADINGDGLNDIKILFPNYASGAYNYYCQTVLLCQNKNGTFNDIIYSDIYENFENKPERDFNNDGQYEIITQTFQQYGAHNYWLFNLYNYKNGGLVNVNALANYPIMIPLDSYEISTKITRKKMKSFAIKSPVE